MVSIYIDSKVKALRELHADFLDKHYSNVRILDALDRQARKIHEAHNTGNEAVVFHLGSWSEDFIGQDANSIMNTQLSIEQARQTIAREHGFECWADVESLRRVMLDETFEKTVDAVIEGDITLLQAQLNELPELVSQRSQYGHKATLLHYVGANGVESYRQITPLNATTITRCLLDAGADANSVANIYGGSTTLNLVLTSTHPNNAGVAKEIANVLMAAGAS